MQDVSATRLPPLDIQVKKLAREPPDKAWPKFKKVLIDYPRDRNLLYRQKLWDFQKSNRGAFRSHVTSLPEIPYRVNTNKPETVSVGTQSDMNMMHQYGLKLILPQIKKTMDKAMNKVDIYLNKEIDGRESGFSERDGVVNYDDSEIEDPGFEFDSVKRRKNAGTMTNPMSKTFRRELKRPLMGKKILKDNTVNQTERPSSRKMVKFADEEKENMDIENIDLDLEKVEELIEQSQEERQEIEEFPELAPVENLELEKVESRISSGRSTSSASSLSLEAENVGPSSRLSLDPLSVLDFLSGSRVGDARVMGRENGRKRDAEKDLDEAPRKSKVKAYDVEADRKWFKRLVGDKDIIDSSNYESFARTRPNNDSFSDSNEKYIDLGKNSSRRSTNYTPRINGELSSNKSQSRTSNNQSVATKKQGETPTKTRSNSRRAMIGIGKFY